MGAFGIWKLLILLGIVFVIFGSKKLKNLGPDLGHAIKGFKSALDEGTAAAKTEAEASTQNATVKSESPEDAR
jgi:sec-independent protein translocase protein TatA